MLHGGEMLIEQRCGNDDHDECGEDIAPVNVRVEDHQGEKKHKYSSGSEIRLFQNEKNRNPHNGGEQQNGRDFIHAMLIPF